MAYAAVHSLVHTISNLLDSSRISFTSSTRETLRSALRHATSLKHALQHGSDVDERIIIEEARKLEDAIEFPLLSQSPTISSNLDDSVDCFVKTAEEREQIIEEQKAAKTTVEEDVEESEEDGEMVGLRDQFLQIRDMLLDDVGRVIWISGMAGIGKSALAKKTFDDPLVKKHFQCRAFVRLGLKRWSKETIFQAIMDQLNLENQSKKYFIVLDDAWDQTSIDPLLQATRLEEEKGNVVLVTSRTDSDYSFYSRFKMRFMNEEESWELLRRKVFGEEECSPQLVKAGKKIAEKCEGLPLLIPPYSSPQPRRFQNVGTE